MTSVKSWMNRSIRDSISINLRLLTGHLNSWSLNAATRRFFKKACMICFMFEMLHLPPLRVYFPQGFFFWGFLWMLKYDKDDKFILDRCAICALICVTLTFSALPWRFTFLSFSQTCGVHRVQFLSHTVLQVDLWLFISHWFISALPLTPTHFPSGTPVVVHQCDSVSPADVGGF